MRFTIILIAALVAIKTRSITKDIIDDDETSIMPFVCIMILSVGVILYQVVMLLG